MDTQSAVVRDIIKEQALVIGEQLAKSLAESTGVVSFASSDVDNLQVTSAQPKAALESIVNAYAKVFGKASINVCLNVISRFPKNEVTSFVPDSFINQIQFRSQ